MYAKITAIGSYVPDRVLANAELERLVDTSDEWIVKRTGIKERRIAAADQFTSHLAIAAVRQLLSSSGKQAADIDFIIVCTHTPDLPFPAVSSLIQSALQIPQAGAMDLNAACAGFVYGLQTAWGLVSSGLYRKVLVVAADVMSKITDYTDRSTCILFGDGAGAVLVEQTAYCSGFLASDSLSDGSGAHLLYRTGLAKQMYGQRLPDNDGNIMQNGRELYKWVVQHVPLGMKRIADKSGVALEEIDWFIPHSANLRMIESICEKSCFPVERTKTSMKYYGNTSAASIPITLDESARKGEVKNGELLLLYGFGAGLSMAGLLVKWDLS